MSWRDICSNIAATARDTFGESVTYTPADGSEAYAVRGVFHVSQVQVDPDTHAEILTSQPQIDFKKADLRGEPRQGDVITVNGSDFSVSEKSDDGWAMVRLTLVEA